MLTRITSGIVMGVSVLALLLYCSWFYFAILVALVALIGSDEYQKMIKPERGLSSRLFFSVITMLLATSPLIGQLNLSTQHYVTLSSSLWAVSFLLVAAYHLRRPLPLQESAGSRFCS